MINVKELQKKCQEFSVLYIEDDSSIRDVMGTYLKKFFKNVVVATDGLEGLNAYKLGDFDIVITDFSMPNMSGLEMIKEIKNLKNTQAVLITTAHNESEYMDEAMEIGIDGYILKPFDFQQLNQEIHSLVLKLKQGR